MKAFLERVGVVVATNPGLLKHKEVIISGSTYWNMVYGKDIGDIYKDEEGINNMHNLGQNMAWL